MAKADYYALLGVDKDVDAAALKKAYRDKARKLHPDRNPDNPEAEEQFKQVSEAYQVLSDPEKRSAYDRFGHEGVRGGAGFHDVGDVFSHFGDIFGDIFGFGGFGGRQRGPARGRDIQVGIVLNMREAAFGIEKDIDLRYLDLCSDCGGTGAKDGKLTQCSVCQGSGQSTMRQGMFLMSSPCRACGGRGQSAQAACETCDGRAEVARERTVAVKIPAGVAHGQALRLPEQGATGEPGAPAGNLLVEIGVEEDEIFRRDGSDLLHELRVNFVDAALGGQVPAPAFEPPGEAQERTIKLSKGTQSGDTVVIRQGGITRLRGRGRGDAIYIIRVHVPEKLPRKVKKQLEELRTELDP